MTFIELAERAREQLTTVTGLKPVVVSATYRDDQGWHVLIDMLEMKRVPDSTDVLGYYEVLLDEEGNMLRFKRKRSHLRSEPVEDDLEN